MRFHRAFAAMLRVNISNMLQYRAETFLWSIWGIVNPTVLYVVWVAATSGAEGGTIAGLNQNGFAIYYFNLMVVGHVTAAWDVYTLSQLIKQGSLSPQLLRPILPMWDSVTGNIAYKITTLMFVLPMWAVFLAIVRPDFTAEPWQIGLGILATILGGMLNYMACYTVSLVAFWATKLDAVGEIYFGMCMIFGGRVAPMGALPEFILLPAQMLPFKWMFAFPTELLSGMVATPGDAITGLSIQALWVALMVFVFRTVWRLAIRRYSAVSG